MKYIRMILPALLTVTIISVLLLYLSNLTAPKNNTQEAGHDTWAAYGFEAEPADSIDAVILGDSESRTNMSPMEMFHIAGFTSYCCGINMENVSEAYEMLKLVFRYQSPKLVILDCNCIYSPFDWKDALMTALESVFPVIRWHDRWKELTPEDFTTVPAYTSHEVRKGYYHAIRASAAPAELTDIYMAESDDQDPIGAINKYYVKRIDSFCRRKGVNLLLLVTPSVMNWNYARHNACMDLSEELEIPFLDLNLMPEEVPIDWSVDTRDRGNHLNNGGMKKVCDWLAPYLRETYQLEDHRDDPAYDASWTDLYDEYTEVINTLPKKDSDS